MIWWFEVSHRHQTHHDMSRQVPSNLLGKGKARQKSSQRREPCAPPPPERTACRSLLAEAGAFITYGSGLVKAALRLVGSVELTGRSGEPAASFPYSRAKCDTPSLLLFFNSQRHPHSWKLSSCEPPASPPSIPLPRLLVRNRRPSLPTVCLFCELASRGRKGEFARRSRDATTASILCSRRWADGGRPHSEISREAVGNLERDAE